MYVNYSDFTTKYARDELHYSKRNNKTRNDMLCTFYADVLDSESENDGPDHTKGHLQVAIDNFYRISVWSKTKVMVVIITALKIVLMSVCEHKHPHTWPITGCKTKELEPTLTPW